MESQYVVPVLIGLMLFLGGCTSYQPRGLTGGFQETRVAEDAYIVEFQGNGLTSSKRARDFAMLRAAEIGKRLGYTYFAVVGSKDLSTLTTVSTGSTSTTSGNVRASGNSATFNSTTTTANGFAAIFNPEVAIGVKYFEGPPTERFLEVFTVDEICDALGKKYRIRPKQ